MKNTMSLFSQLRGEDGGGNSLNLCMGCMELFDTSLGVCPHCGYIYGMGAEEPVFLEPGTVLAGRYYVGKSLGHGSFGVTYIGWDAKLEQKVAIKEFLPSEFSTRMPGRTQVTILAGKKSEQFLDGKKKFINEARKLAKFHSEQGIVKVFDSFEENDSAYIVMELLEGKSLTEYLKDNGTIPENEAIDLLRPVMESLQVVHEAGIIHRDISPDNIFICNPKEEGQRWGEVKLIDFGAARYATTSHTRTITTIIKSGYSPEEQYRSSGDQGPHTDVYALSATLYKMITGKTPPDGMERRTMYETKGKDLLRSPAEYNKNISRVHEVAILNAMNIQIQDRTPNVAAFVQELDSNVPIRRLDGTIKKLPTYRWPKWLKVAVPTAAALIAAFIVLLLTGVIRFGRNGNDVIEIPDRYVAMPNIESMKEAEAVDKVKGCGLKPQMGKSISSPYIDPGMVIYQEYIAGSYIEKGSVVSYKVSIGTGEVEVDGDMIIIPFLKGVPMEEAGQKLVKAGLILDVEEVYYDSDEGLIISSDPEEGEKVPKNTKIKLKVSKGPEPIILELNLVGMMEGEAAQALIDIGLAYPEITYVEDKAEKGTVLAQDVVVGQTVTKGQKLKLTVSGGTTEKLIEVPDVANMDRDKAIKLLEDSGFKVKESNEYSSKIQAGKATRTSPKAGSRRYEGEVIVLYISNGPEPSKDDQQNDNEITVPDVIGKKEKDAIAALNGFNVVKETEYSDKTAAGVVISTNPKAGTKCKQGDSVKLVISLGVKPTEEVLIEIPDVMNQTEKDAKQMLKGLTVTVQQAYSESIATGMAVGTKPKAGTMCKAGDAVTLVISKGPEPEPEPETMILPDVYDLSGAAAKKALQEKLNVNILQEYSKDVIAGNAIRTYPAAGEVVTIGDTVDLYISMGPKQHKITFDGNGGSVAETSRTVDEGSTYGSMPSASRDYYSLVGWYTDRYGNGVPVYSTNVMGDSDVTLYAVWRLNDPKNDWVKAENAPSDAQITEEKWTYSLTERTTSDSSSLDGWTLYDQKTTYGSWSGWGTSPITTDSTKEVETQVVQIHTGYNMREWNYALTSGRRYCNYDPGSPYGAYVWYREEWRSVSDLNGCEAVAPGGWSTIGGQTGKNEGTETGYNITDGLIFFIVSNTYDNQTQYRWRSKSTTYYFVKVSSKTSYTEVKEGGDIALVQRWVKYRER